MGYINKCILLGNLTRDPEVQFVPDKNLQIAKFGIAINRSYKSGNEKKEDTCFIDIVAFGKSAEICGEFLSKGSPVLIEGRLNLSQWEQNGSKRRKHEIIAENVQLLPGQDKVKEANNSGKDYESFNPEDFMNDESIPF